MIDKAYLVAQMESFEAQREHLVAQLHKVDGGMATVRNMIGRIERAEDAKKATEGAEKAATGCD